MFKYTVVLENREKAPCLFSFNPIPLVYACLVIKIGVDFQGCFWLFFVLYQWFEILWKYSDPVDPVYF